MDDHETRPGAHARTHDGAAAGPGPGGLDPRTDPGPVRGPRRERWVRRAARGAARGVYAQARVPEYWVVDLAARSVVVHRDPEPGGLPPYRSVQRLPWTTPLTVLDVTLALADILD